VFRELKTEAEGLRRKISRLDTLEREMMKIHEAYSALRKDEIPLLYIHVLPLKRGFLSLVSITFHLQNGNVCQR
jgi:hypothetical protein